VTATPGSGQPFLSVVIPVYRGEKVIRQTIEAVERHASRRGWEIEIIVAVSESGDRTRELAEAAMATYSNVVVLDATAQFGKGGAVKSGMAVARGKICCFIDADNAVSFEQIDRALPRLGRYDIVIGSRYVTGGDPGRRSMARTAVSRGGNLLMQLVLGMPYADTRAPLKLFRKDVAKRLFAASRLRGFGFDSEILFLAGRFGYTVDELPVRWAPFEESTVDIRVEVVRSLWELLQIRWNWLRGRYGD
jgi:glycosyltransferase involved in cell wall biosynthesis